MMGSLIAERRDGVEWREWVGRRGLGGGWMVSIDTTCGIDFFGYKSLICGCRFEDVRSRQEDVDV